MARCKQAGRKSAPTGRKPRPPLKSRIQFEMRAYRRELCPFMPKPEYFNRCEGRRHKMKRVAPLLVEAASTGARGDALFEKLAELETAAWAHMGNKGPQERQEQPAWVQSFTAKGSMRCT